MAMDRAAEGEPGRPARLASLGGPPASPHLLLAFAVLCWSGNFVVGRAARDVIPPLAFNFWRWTIALLILLPFAGGALWRHRHIVRREWKVLAALALSGMTAFHSLIYVGLSLTEAINGFVYFATSPLFFVLFTWLLFRERLSGAQALGIVASMLGALVVVARGEPGLLLELRVATGDVWLIAAVMLWALYSVLLRRRPADLPPLVLLAATIVFALAFLAPFYGLELLSGRRIDLGAESLISLGYVSVFASVLAYIAYNRGVREVGPTPAGVSLQLMPVFGAVLAIVFLGERMAGYHWLGAGLVLLGILLTGRRR